jgi:hypothetical protein
MGPSADQLAVLRRYSLNPWKFLVAVAVLESKKVIDEDFLPAFFLAYPSAGAVDDSPDGRLALWDQVGGFGRDKPLAERICDLAAAVLECVSQRPADLRSVDCLKWIRGANQFWRSCYRAVYG